MLIKGKVHVAVSMLFAFAIIMSPPRPGVMVSMRITSLANNINCFLSPLVDFLLTSVAICHKSANLDGTCELCGSFCLSANYCIAQAIVSDTDTASSLLNENQSIMSLDCVQLETINPNFSLRYIAHSAIKLIIRSLIFNIF